jgi:hypothetical protein
MRRIYLLSRCPVCGNKIFLNSHGYQCESCDFHIPNYICNRRIAIEEAEFILSDRKIILDGFSTNAGLVFSSIPVVKGNTIYLDNTVANITGLGRIIVGNRGFVCDKDKNRQRSHLRIKRMYNGHMLTVEEVNILLRNGCIIINTFDDKGNPITQSLHFSKDKQKVSFQNK